MIMETYIVLQQHGLSMAADREHWTENIVLQPRFKHCMWRFAKSIRL